MKDPSQSTRASLIIESVYKEYDSPGGNINVLQNVSLTVSPGETVAIVGPSGSGKSTLLNIIGSLDKPTSGSVRLGKEEVTGLVGAGLARYRSIKVGFVFQDHHLLPQCTALENVILPALAIGAAAEKADRAKQLLERIGLGHRLNFFPAQLSGGERSRIGIARALINRPLLLLCDEPTGNLDSASGRNIVTLLGGVAKEERAMFIMVTHNVELAGCLSRCLELKNGSLIERKRD